MLSFIIRRLLITIPLVLLASMLVFLLVANSGDPLADLRGRQPPVPPQVIEAREKLIGLDKPLPQRYWHWVTNFVQGDMGKSIRGIEVRPLLWQRMKVTLRMVILASILAIVLAVGAGVLSGLFGVGGGIVTTPAVDTLLGGTAIQAIATPLPVILPTSLVGSYTYAKAGEVSFRAARFPSGFGPAGTT